MNIFEDKTEMPTQPDFAVTSVRVPGEILSGASRDMQMAGQRNWPTLAVQNIERPRFGHSAGYTRKT